MGGENLNKSTSDAGEAWSNMAANVEAEKNVAEKRAEVTEKAKKNSTLKKFVLGAVFALGVMTMVGCGKDGDASAVSEPTPSVSIEYNTPTPSYEINDDEDGNSAYKPGEITVIDGEQDGGDGNDDADIEPGGNGGEVEVGVDNIWESEYWDGDTFHLDEYAKSLGYKDGVTVGTLQKAYRDLGVRIRVTNDGSVITCYSISDASTICSIECRGTGSSSECVQQEFCDNVLTNSTSAISEKCAGLNFCASMDNIESMLNGGELPVGWAYGK